MQNLLKDAPEAEVTIKEEKPDKTTLTEDLCDTTGTLKLSIGDF